MLDNALLPIRIQPTLTAASVRDKPRVTIRQALRGLGLDVRAGLHTGECDRRNEDLSGIAVHIAARIQALAAPNEVLVSQTVRDLIAGSQIARVDGGEHELRGVPGIWRVYSVNSIGVPE